MAKITETNFKSTLMDLMKATTTLQKDIQSLVTFALTYYVGTGNTLYLTMLRREVEKRRGLSLRALDGYIRHMVPVVWGEAKDGKMVYKKAGEPVINPEPICNAWYLFTKATSDAPSIKKALDKVLESYAYPKEGAAQPTVEDRELALAALALLTKKAA